MELILVLASVGLFFMSRHAEGWSKARQWVAFAASVAIVIGLAANPTGRPAWLVCLVAAGIAAWRFGDLRLEEFAVDRANRKTVIVAAPCSCDHGVDCDAVTTVTDIKGSSVKKTPSPAAVKAKAASKKAVRVAGHHAWKTAKRITK